MIKSAADILADIEGAPKPKRHAPVIKKRAIVRAPANPGHQQSAVRDDDYYAEARAYRLAAIEYGVHPLMPKDLYRRTP